MEMLFLWWGYYRTVEVKHFLTSEFATVPLRVDLNVARVPVSSYQQGCSLLLPSAASPSSSAPLPTRWQFVPTESKSPPPGGKGWRRQRSWTLRRSRCFAWSHSWSAETCCLSPEAWNKHKEEYFQLRTHTNKLYTESTVYTTSGNEHNDTPLLIFTYSIYSY